MYMIIFQKVGFILCYDFRKHTVYKLNIDALKVNKLNTLILTIKIIKSIIYTLSILYIFIFNLMV